LSPLSSKPAHVALLPRWFGWLVSRLGRWVGLEIERDHAEALHSAIARGVRQAVSLVRSEAKPERATVDVESRLIAETAIYLEKLMPDALDHFGLTDEALDRLIRAYLGPDAALGKTPPGRPEATARMSEPFMSLLAALLGVLLDRLAAWQKARRN
jgi:hypothetical protein